MTAIERGRRTLCTGARRYTVTYATSDATTTPRAALHMSCTDTYRHQRRWNPKSRKMPTLIGTTIRIVLRRSVS